MIKETHGECFILPCVCFLTHILSIKVAVLEFLDRPSIVKFRGKYTYVIHTFVDNVRMVRKCMQSASLMDEIMDNSILHIVAYSLICEVVNVSWFREKLL